MSSKQFKAFPVPINVNWEWTSDKRANTSRRMLAQDLFASFLNHAPHVRQHGCEVVEQLGRLRNNQKGPCGNASVLFIQKWSRKLILQCSTAQTNIFNVDRPIDQSVEWTASFAHLPHQVLTLDRHTATTQKSSPILHNQGKSGTLASMCSFRRVHFHFTANQMWPALQS